MIVHPTKLPGVLILEADVHPDERGSIMTAWMADDLKSRGLDATVAQCNLVRNYRRGTLRGLHYQRPPFAETKLVRAIRGTIYDVAVDVRPDSPTFRQWLGLELSEGHPQMFYLPHGIAHGYQTLTEDAEVMYFVSARYSSEHQAGVRWNDRAFGIEWPIDPPAVIHPRDASYPDFHDAASAARRA